MRGPTGKLDVRDSPPLGTIRLISKGWLVSYLWWLRKNAGLFLRRGDRFYLSETPIVSLWRAILFQFLDVVYFASHYGGRINKTCFLIRCGKRLVKREMTVKEWRRGNKLNLFWKMWGGEDSWGPRCQPSAITVTQPLCLPSGLPFHLFHNRQQHTCERLLLQTFHL